MTEAADPAGSELDEALAGILADEVPRGPLEDEQGRLRLSFSRVDTFERCPRRFRYQYVDGLPQAPAPQLSFGTSIHAVLEWLYDRKHPRLPSLDEALKVLFDTWDTSGYEGAPRESQLEAYEHARAVISAFHARITREGFRLPAATEAWFELPVDDDILVVGAIDRVDVDESGALHVVDYKTNRSARSRVQVRSSLQLAIYALATRELFGTLPASVALDFVVPGLVVRVPVEDLDLASVPRRLRDVAARIRAGEDQPVPHRLCDWCDFRTICPAWAGSAADAGDGAGGSGTDTVLGRAVLERDGLRRSLVRDARRLRQLEEGIRRISAADGGREEEVPG